MTVRCHWFAPLVLAAALGCGNGSGPSTAPTATAPIPVTVAPLGIRPVQRSVTAVGTLYGFDEVTLAPKVDGRVERVFVDTGDVAVPGAVVLELDPTDYLLAVAEARQALDAELARIGLTALPGPEFDPESVPTVRRAEASLANARTRFARVKDLYARQASSKEEFDLADTEVKLADAAKRDAVAQTLATLASARLRNAALDTAVQRVADTKLRVPVPEAYWPWAAIVGPGATPARYAVAVRMVSHGDMVRSNPVTNAFKLVLDSALKLRLAVPERYAPDIEIGQIAEVTVDAYPGVAFRGRVTRISPTVDALNRTFGVEVTIPNLDRHLKCGGFARAAISTRIDPSVPTVPPHAIATFAGVTKVFVVDGDTAKTVEVQTGTRDKDWVEVIGKFPPEARVITSGLSQLADGTPIRIRQ